MQSNQSPGAAWTVLVAAVTRVACQLQVEWQPSPSPSSLPESFSWSSVAGCFCDRFLPTRLCFVYLPTLLADHIVMARMPCRNNSLQDMLLGWKCRISRIFLWKEWRTGSEPPGSAVSNVASAVFVSVLICDVITADCVGSIWRAVFNDNCSWQSGGNIQIVVLID